MKGNSFLVGFLEVCGGLVGLALCAAVLLPTLPPTPGFSQHQWRIVMGVTPPVSGLAEAAAICGLVLAIYVIFLGARRIAKTPIQ